jgi:hypothetical protein
MLAETGGWLCGSVWTWWQAVQASGAGASQATVVGVPPFGKWHPTEHVVGAVPSPGVIVPSAVLVPPGNVYGGSKLNVPHGWHVAHANVLMCLACAPGVLHWSPVESWL